LPSPCDPEESPDGEDVGAGVDAGVSVGVGAGVGVELGVGAGVAVGAGLGVGGAMGSEPGVAVGVGVAVGAAGSELAVGVGRSWRRGGRGRALSAPPLPCAPAAVKVVGGDSACELNSPNVEPTGEPRTTIEPTAARRTA
jgi:hypothetical protein